LISGKCGKALCRSDLPVAMWDAGCEICDEKAESREQNQNHRTTELQNLRTTTKRIEQPIRCRSSLSFDSAQDPSTSSGQAGPGGCSLLPVGRPKLAERRRLLPL